MLALKRLIDLVASSLGLVLLAVPMAIIGTAVKLDSRGPVFFRQERIGIGGAPFVIWKFRTMVDGAIRMGLGEATEANDQRLTRVGCVLRQFSLDELPQLINVWKGEMSLIGPRPWVAYLLEHYDTSQGRRLSMKPGMSSLAAVKGRNSLPWQDRIELDIYYVERWSLWLDLNILVSSLWLALVSREGVYDTTGINEEYAVRRSNTWRG